MKRLFVIITFLLMTVGYADARINRINRIIKITAYGKEFIVEKSNGEIQMINFGVKAESPQSVRTPQVKAASDNRNNVSDNKKVVPDNRKVEPDNNRNSEWFFKTAQDANSYLIVKIPGDNRYHYLKCPFVTVAYKPISIADAKKEGLKNCRECYTPEFELPPMDLTEKDYEGLSEIDAKQKWIMENINFGTEWNPEEMIRRFGPFEQYISERYNPRIVQMFYFKEIDMAFVVNLYKMQIDTFRKGRSDF